MAGNSIGSDDNRAIHPPVHIALGHVRSTVAKQGGNGGRGIAKLPGSRGEAVAQRVGRHLGRQLGELANASPGLRKPLIRSLALFVWEQPLLIERVLQQALERCSRRCADGANGTAGLGILQVDHLAFKIDFGAAKPDDFGTPRTGLSSRKPSRTA